MSENEEVRMTEKMFILHFFKGAVSLNNLIEAPIRVVELLYYKAHELGDKLYKSK